MRSGSLLAALDLCMLLAFRITRLVRFRASFYASLRMRVPPRVFSLLLYSALHHCSPLPHHRCGTLPSRTPFASSSPRLPLTAVIPCNVLDGIVFCTPLTAVFAFATVCAYRSPFCCCAAVIATASLLVVCCCDNASRRYATFFVTGLLLCTLALQYLFFLTLAALFLRFTIFSFSVSLAYLLGSAIYRLFLLSCAILRPSAIPLYFHCLLLFFTSYCLPILASSATPLSHIYSVHGCTRMVGCHMYSTGTRFHLYNTGMFTLLGFYALLPPPLYWDYHLGFCRKVAGLTTRLSRYCLYLFIHRAASPHCRCPLHGSLPHRLTSLCLCCSAHTFPAHCLSLPLPYTPLMPGSTSLTHARSHSSAYLCPLHYVLPPCISLSPLHYCLCLDRFPLSVHGLSFCLHSLLPRLSPLVEHTDLTLLPGTLLRFSQRFTCAATAPACICRCVFSPLCAFCPRIHRAVLCCLGSARLLSR